MGYILLEYIIIEWSMDSVIYLIKTNGNISHSLGITEKDFESGWHEFVEENYLK